MKRRYVLLPCAALFLAACEGWPVSMTTYNPPTPVPSRTPIVRSPTPVVLSATPIVTTPSPATIQPTESITLTPSVAPTTTQTLLPTITSTPAVISASILGCDTSLDLTHGMGEVTDAFVTIRNPTSSDIADLCATLYALDEGRPHPDKTKCIPILAPGYQATFKLTVDTTYEQKTPIQVDVNSGASLLLRVGEPACTEIGVLAPAPDELGVPKPIATVP